MKKSALLLLIPLFSHCTSKAPVDKGIAMQAYNLAPDTKSLAGIQIPILRSPTLDRRWGNPRIRILANGGYALIYMNPRENFETLSIYAQPGQINSDAPTPPPYKALDFDEKTKAPLFVDTPQPWRSASILGRSVHYYTLTAGDGADAAEVSTITFPAAPNASYRLTATSNRENFDQSVESYLSSAAFAKP